jgi:hypothetical protein
MALAGLDAAKLPLDVGARNANQVISFAYPGRWQHPLVGKRLPGDLAAQRCSSTFVGAAAQVGVQVETLHVSVQVLRAGMPAGLGADWAAEVDTEWARRGRGSTSLELGAGQIVGALLGDLRLGQRGAGVLCTGGSAPHVRSRSNERCPARGGSSDLNLQGHNRTAAQGATHRRMGLGPGNQLLELLRWRPGGADRDLHAQVRQRGRNVGHP